MTSSNKNTSSTWRLTKPTQRRRPTQGYHNSSSSQAASTHGRTDRQADRQADVARVSDRLGLVGCIDCVCRRVPCSVDGVCDRLVSVGCVEGCSSWLTSVSNQTTINHTCQSHLPINHMSITPHTQPGLCNFEHTVTNLLPVQSNSASYPRWGWDTQCKLPV